MFKVVITAVMAAALMPVAADAQLIEMRREGNAGMALEALRPNFEGDAGASFLTAGYFLSGHTHFRGHKVVLELPVAYSSFEATQPNAEGSSSTSIGNPYIGLEMKKGAWTVDVGARAPLGDEKDAAAVGAFADMARLEAFGNDLTTLRASFRRDIYEMSGVTFNVQAAPIWLLPSNASGELVLGYALGARYAQPMWRADARFVGRAIATESELNFRDASTHQLGLAADFGAARFRPGIYVAMPLDQAVSDVVGTVFGVTLQVSLGN